MTENNQTQDQADFNKSQQPQAGEQKQDQGDQSATQAKTGQEKKSFEGGQADPAEGKADQQTQQFAQGGQQSETEIEDESETEIDDEDDTQAETSNT